MNFNIGDKVVCYGCVEGVIVDIVSSDIFQELQDIAIVKYTPRRGDVLFNGRSQVIAGDKFMCKLNLLKRVSDVFMSDSIPVLKGAKEI